jgi:hypothetical protein
MPSSSFGTRGSVSGGMILAAKLAARELGPVVFADGGEIWNTES